MTLSPIASPVFAEAGETKPPAAQVIAGEHWRISVLTDALIRFEWSDDDTFVDNPTQVVVNRDFGESPRIEVKERGGYLEIDSDAVHISYDRGPFWAGGLYATVKGVNAGNNTWHFGDIDYGNLGGTVRTLDTVDGATPLEDGVLSRDGWAVLDDSHSAVVVADDDPANPQGVWVRPRAEAGIDFYLFAYGHRYQQAIRDFHRLTGPVPLLPRFTLGNWWSRYHPYSQREYEELMDRFAAEGLPFSVAVIDMDWHLVDDVDPKYGSGWTGYTWNRKLFPDPPAFLRGLHERGLRTALNLHPRDGIRAFEDAYPDMAWATGIDPDSGEAVQFDPSSPAFVDAYFKHVLHPMERQGVDFWWLDWQQGGVSRQRGLDPLWMLNALHYADSRRDGRPGLTFSRYAGPGSHRYPVGFSGDTVVSWDSLVFQPYFTATASNIGYGWWSHDIGGHMYGVRDEELQVRWYQLGTFSPINRLHSAISPFTGKEPWNFHEPVRSVMSRFLRLRHELLPYLHTMNHRAAEESLPIVEPMYWKHPEAGEAYGVSNQYWFGTQLVVAPITSPADHASMRAHAPMWLPEGTWFDCFDGRRYEAGRDGRTLNVWRTIERMPVFAQAGALVPMQRLGELGHEVNDVANPSAMTLLAFPSADGCFTMIEDDGAAGRAETECSLRWRCGERGDTVIAIDARDEIGVIPGDRRWDIVIRGVEDVETDAVRSNVGACEAWYERERRELRVAVPLAVGGRRLEVTIEGGLHVAADDWLEDAKTVLHDAQIGYPAKDKAYALLERLGRDALSALTPLAVEEGLPASVLGALVEVMQRRPCPS